MAGVNSKNIPRIASVITVPVEGMRPYGLACKIPGDSSLAGLIAPENLPGNTVTAGDTTQAAVLDVHERDGIVDLSADEVRQPLLSFASVVERKPSYTILFQYSS